MNNSKVKLLSALAMSLVLAACAGNDTSDELDQNAGANQSGAQVDTYNSENVSGNAYGDSFDQAAANLTRVYYFGFDQHALTAEIRAELDKVAAVLKATNANVRLEGHADERGTREYNLALGERRAQAVANYLTVQGVSASQLEVISYGEEKPAVAGQGEEAFAKNRRVELVK